MSPQKANYNKNKGKGWHNGTEGNSSRRQKGNIVTISGKTPRSAEQKRLQHSGGTGKGLEDCGKASIGVWGSTESRGHDTQQQLHRIHASTTDEDDNDTTSTPAQHDSDDNDTMSTPARQWWWHHDHHHSTTPLTEKGSIANVRGTEGHWKNQGWSCRVCAKIDDHVPLLPILWHWRCLLLGWTLYHYHFQYPSYSSSGLTWVLYIVHSCTWCPLLIISFFFNVLEQGKGVCILFL